MVHPTINEPQSAPHRRFKTGTVLLHVALIVGLPTAICGSALAQHPRKAGHKSQPVPVSKTAPDTTATIAPSKRAPDAPDKEAKPITAAPAYTTTRYDEGLPKPFDLPTAPRARMRACGLKWQTIKLSGEARSDTWREFATKCLVENSGTAAR